MNLPKYHWLGQGVPFREALELQKECVQQITAEREQAGTFFFLEHAPVYTIGNRREEAALPTHLPYPVEQINRGGLATYHGPGQLVGYLVTDLVPLGKDLHAYLRMIEEALILACAEIGVNAGREPGLTGVWANARKLCSMGVGVRKWVSMHGFAMNVTPESLPPFSLINPCGIDGVTMSCLHNEGAWRGTAEQFAEIVFQKMNTLLEITV